MMVISEAGIHDRISFRRFLKTQYDSLYEYVARQFPDRRVLRPSTARVCEILVEETDPRRVDVGPIRKHAAKFQYK